MKYILILLMTFSLQLQAQEEPVITRLYQTVSQIGTCNQQALEKDLCESDYGQPCYFLTERCEYASVTISEVDDLTKPILEKRQETSCITFCEEETCEAPLCSELLEGFTCEEGLQKQDSAGLYCEVQTGFEKKTEYTVGIDPVKHTAYLQSLVNKERLERRAELRREGNIIIDEISNRNELKGLSGVELSQVFIAYAPIESALRTGSLTLAFGAVTTTELDGVIMTEDDRTFILGQITGALARVAAKYPTITE